MTRGGTVDVGTVCHHRERNVNIMSYSFLSVVWSLPPPSLARGLSFVYSIRC